MIEIDDKLISDEIIEKKFVCDLNACKGACCVSGDSGAPLEINEIKKIEENLEHFLPYLSEKSKEIIRRKGIAVKDDDGDWVTPIHENKGACVFVYYDENNIAKCSMEKAYYQGKSDFLKPISCHLYPIRISEFKNFTALNYHSWDLCKPACSCGEKLDVPVYKFLKNSLIRKFGEEFYQKLDAVYEWKQNNN